jgi:hypothetical protein
MQVIDTTFSRADVGDVGKPDKTDPWFSMTNASMAMAHVPDDSKHLYSSAIEMKNDYPKCL